MDIINGLKTSDRFVPGGLGSTLCYFLCNSALESHAHLFFEYSYLMDLIKKLLHVGNFFLIDSNLLQVLSTIGSLKHIILRNLCYLIIYVIIFMI